MTSTTKSSHSGASPPLQQHMCLPNYDCESFAYQSMSLQVFKKGFKQYLACNVYESRLVVFCLKELEPQVLQVLLDFQICLVSSYASVSRS